MDEIVGEIELINSHISGLLQNGRLKHECGVIFVLNDMDDDISPILKREIRKTEGNLFFVEIPAKIAKRFKNVYIVCIPP